MSLKLKVRLAVAAAASAVAALALVGSAGAAVAPTVVSPAAMNGWVFVNDNSPANPPTGTLVSGPATPPLGSGSAQLATAGNSDGQVLATGAYVGTPLSSITKLEYWTHQSGPTLAIALQFDIRYRPTDTAYGGRLVYEPYQNGTRVVGAGWQRWQNLTSGRWWATRTTAAGSAGLCPQANPCTWSQLLTAYPNATINGGLIFKAGSNWGTFTGAVDALTVGLGGVDTTFDFEATIPDTTPPVLTLPADFTVQGASPAGATVAYATSALDAVDGPVATACSPASGTPFPLGVTTVTCSASDVAGNTATGSFSVTVSLVAITAAPAAVSATQTATFVWSTITFNRFLCSLDGAPFAPCSPSRTYQGLAAGAHTFCVRATADAVATCRSWTIVSPGAPVPTITGVSVAGRTATVGFTADQPATRFTCSLDGGAFRSCSSLLRYNGLARGSHTVLVHSTNFAGETSVTPASVTFVIP